MADDFLKRLPLFEWRGRQYPLLARSVSFGHEGAADRIQYRDNDFIQQLGAHSLTFRYTLPMREGIAKFPYRNLFTKEYPLLFAAMRDRSKGLLVDPVLGPFVCVPQLFDDTTDPRLRDGTDVQIEFKHAPDLDESEDLKPISIQGLNSDAGELDKEIEKVDWEQEPSPGPTADPLDAISGVGQQVSAQGGKAVAALHDYAYKMEKAEQQVERLENPDAWPLINATRRNRAVALELSERAKDPTKRVVMITNNYSRSLTAVAAAVGMSLEDLLELNGDLAQRSIVDAGTVIRVFKRSSNGRPA
jgi:hypothetical protein